MIPLDAERYITRKFPAAERPEAIALVASATIHDGSPASPRLMRCVLVGSRGSLGKLRQLVADLRIDYRDVIMAGEYVVQEGKLHRARDLNEPIGED